MIHIVIYGYYGQNNLGDDLFEYVFKFLIGTRYRVTFTCNIIPNDVDIIIYGGGDLFNDFFYNSFKLPQHPPQHIPIYVISAGIPYPSHINKGSYSIFDIIMLRSKYDVDDLKLITNNEVYYYPDIVFMLPMIPNKIPNKIPNEITNEITNEIPNESVKKIGVFLMGTLDNRESEKGLIKFLNYIIDRNPGKYEIILYSFNTKKGSNVNDITINDRIYNDIHSGIIIDRNKIECENVLNVFKSLDYTICMKYHAHVLSIMSEKPILSINGVRKTRCLMNEAKLSEYVYSIENGEIVDPELLYRKFLLLLDCREDIISKMKTYNRETQQELLDFKNKFYYIMDNPIFTKREKIITHFIYKNDYSDIITKIIRYLVITINEHEHEHEHERIIRDLECNAYSLRRIIRDQNDLKSEFKKELVENAIFMITWTYNTKYSYGFSEKLLDCSLRDNIIYIIEDHKREIGMEIGKS